MTQKFLRRVCVAPVAVACVVGLAACGVGTKSIKGSEVEKQISDKIFEQRQARAKSIDCPKELEAKKGKKYECTLTAPNGDQLPVAVEMTDDNGKYKFEVLPAK